MYRHPIPLLFVAVTMICLLTGCSRDETPTSPAIDSHALDGTLAAGEVMMACGWPFDPETELPASLALLLDKNQRCIVQDFQREVIVGDVAHYRLILAVGPGEHDVIGLHRVVRERRPHVPIKARESLFCVHGMGKDFVGNFMPGRKSPLLPDEVGFAVFMAQNDIDVWGIDNSYTLVPGGLVDHGFAAGWGMDKSIDDIAAGIGVARLVRLFTGNGWRKMTLLGYSQGLQMGYALLNREAQRPRGLRSVGAYIPVDWGLAFDDPGQQMEECEYLAGYVDLFNEGVYGFDDDPDGFLYSVGYLAQTEPDAPSPFYEGFTNLEVFLFFTAIASTEGGAVWWAGLFDDEGWPVDLAYTTRLMATEFWIRWAPMHPPVRLWVDFHSLVCENSIWETHLGSIDLPVFSLEAAGGGGPIQAGTLARLVNADVTRLVVQLLGPDDRWRDFAHIDLFSAENAAEVAWQPTLDWLRGRQDRLAAEPVPYDDTLNAADAARLVALDWTPPSGRWLGQPAPGNRAGAQAHQPVDVHNLRLRNLERLRGHGRP